MVWYVHLQLCRAVRPPHFQILSEREWMIDDVISQHMMRSFVPKNLYLWTLIITNLPRHKTREKDVVGIVTFDLIGLLPTDHIIILQWHTGVYEELFDVNIKNIIAQTITK